VTDAKVDVHTTDGTVRIVLSGEVDLANATAVEEQILAAITNQVKTASIDLTGLTYLDSAGLRILFTLAAGLPVLQISLELVAALGSPARRVLELAGIEPLIVLRPAADRPAPHRPGSPAGPSPAVGH
jgi:anti-anti-sigma factor